MLNVHVVTSANRHLYVNHMDEYFHWRYRIYVMEKRWLAENPSEREIDQFDHQDAFYLLGYVDGAFASAARLMPCSAPTLLGDVFPHLASVKGVPTDSRWADWTRMFSVPAARERGHFGATAAMCCAVMEYCVSEGLSWVGGVQETYWLPRWSDFGWDVSVLGLPQPIAGTSCVAAFMKVSEAALETARATTGISKPQIVHQGIRRAFLPSSDQHQRRHLERRIAG